MWRDSRKIERVCGRVFLFVFLSALPLVWIHILVHGKTIRFLNVENRNTTVLPELNASSFLDGSFQKKLEEALSDQMPLSETIRLKNLTFKRNVFNKLSWISNRSLSGYHLIGDNAYTYKDHSRVVINNRKLVYSNLERNAGKIQNDADYYADLPIRNKYQYIVMTDAVIDFDQPNDDYVEQVAAFYPEFKQSFLRVPDYETYARYFLKSDHHWNYLGAYQGYKDIIQLMFGGNESVKVPAEEIAFKYNTVGSRSRMAYPMTVDDPFISYRFEYKDHDVYLGNVRAEYGKQSYYNDKNMREAGGEISYSEYYGFDEEIILYDFKQPKKENLIIVGYSDTNAINELVASHFNKTWIFDTRFTPRSLFEKIISENDIQNLLLIPNAGNLIPAMPETPGGYE